MARHTEIWSEYITRWKRWNRRELLEDSSKGEEIKKVADLDWFGVQNRNLKEAYIQKKTAKKQTFTCPNRPTYSMFSEYLDQLRDLLLSVRILKLKIPQCFFVLLVVRVLFVWGLVFKLQIQVI